MGSKTVLAVLALSLVATQAAPAAPSGSLFPLAAGNRWTLRDVERGSSATVSVATNRASGLLLRGFPGTADLRVRTEGSTIAAWDSGNDRWEPFLKVGAAAVTPVQYFVVIPFQFAFGHEIVGSLLTVFIIAPAPSYESRPNALKKSL